MNTSSDPSISPTPPIKKPSLYPPEPAHNPSIAPPFSKSPSFSSMTSTLQPTASEQDTTTHPPPHHQHRPTLSSEYTSNHPFSAFYSHPTTRTSLDQAKSASSKLHINVYEHDLENQSGLTTTNNSPPPPPPPQQPHHDHSPTTTSASDEKTKGNPKRISTMWASIPRCAAHLSSTNTSSSKRQHSRHNITGTVRGSRACAPYRRLSRGQKWVVQILLAIVVVGAATALGVGISKAVGAGVWKSDTSTSPIGNV